MNNERIIVDKYDLMEEQLKDDARSIKFIKNLGEELISKIKMIDKEIDVVNPERKQWNRLSDSDREKLSSLHQLKECYRSQFDIVIVLLNKSDNLIGSYSIKRYKEKGLEDKFFIKIDGE